VGGPFHGWPLYPTAAGSGADAAVADGPGIYILLDFYTSAMALSIKSEEADRLAREVAQRTGESLTEAVVVSLRERLERTRRDDADVGQRLRRLREDVADLPVEDARSPEEIIGYDEHGLPG